MCKKKSGDCRDFEKNQSIDMYVDPGPLAAVLGRRGVCMHSTGSAARGVPVLDQRHCVSSSPVQVEPTPQSEHLERFYRGLLAPLSYGPGGGECRS